MFSWEGASPNDENLPDLLLVDDLCGNLAFTDTGARRAFVRELYGLRSWPEHRTVIYATRDGDDALAVSDCIAVLDGGGIVQFGTVCRSARPTLPRPISGTPQLSTFTYFIPPL